ncbi:hypothetical protein KJ762_15685 [bacterium]|nr:hypothetical protein [bacterium]MBU1635926.1 hypothetical protein [bacterium]
MALKSAKIYNIAEYYATAIYGESISSFRENSYIPDNRLKNLPVGESYVFR